ncbi:MAG: hypothetical protein F6K00_08850 [Leptolyngbya sp. SIOISBB]|nr:hypothetical protein [Leptolyngbya sp. SIOISBB]
MSEGNVPSRSHDADSLAAAQGQLPLQPDHPPATDDWETVPLLGMPPLSSSEPTARLSTPVVSDSITVKEAELQSRIADLNQCNEVLLSRVNQLEEALERSQQALQQEVERSPRLTEDEKVAEAQTRSVAQLLSELDDTSAALKRQTLLAETLTAQLKTAEERAQRFEQECTILRKRKVERAQELQAAEDTCADLRSRLQRQQQYTLQFKSALEKCLDTAAFQHASHSIENELPQSVSMTSEPTVNTSRSVGMPRSESIRPWAANPTQVPADPQLQSLIKQPAGAEPLTSPETPAQPSLLTTGSPAETTQAEGAVSIDAAKATLPAVDSAAAKNSEAEQKLWQDVERVIESTVTGTTPAPTGIEANNTASTTAAPVAAAISEEPSTPATEFTEPIPWGAPVNSTPSEASELDTAASQGSTLIPTDPDKSPTSELLNGATQENAPLRGTTQENAVFAAATASPANTIPALDAMQTNHSSPSPLVHPLRPQQRKRKSLSAVELPSFPPLPKVPH